MADSNYEDEIRASIAFAIKQAEAERQNIEADRVVPQVMDAPIRWPSAQEQAGVRWQGDYMNDIDRSIGMVGPAHDDRVKEQIMRQMMGNYSAGDT